MFRTLLAAAMLATFAAGTATAQSIPPDYFRGKTINIVAGAGSGDGYDIYSRLLAQHMGRHIPGNPRFVVQNMPGEGYPARHNFIARCRQYGTYRPRRRHRDRRLLDAKNARFDARRFGWIAP